MYVFQNAMPASAYANIPQPEVLSSCNIENGPGHNTEPQATNAQEQILISIAGHPDCQFSAFRKPSRNQSPAKIEHNTGRISLLRNKENKSDPFHAVSVDLSDFQHPAKRGAEAIRPSHHPKMRWCVYLYHHDLTDLRR